MQVLEVNGKTGLKHFHKVPKQVYKGDENYVYPLEGDIELVFSPEKNPSYKYGNAKRWVVLDAQENPIARIAAFYDSKSQSSQAYPVGGIGFFECVEQQEVAFLLFDTAREWLASEGCKAMDGPINFGERHKFWGLLVEGFTQPTYYENYHPEYYKLFFEQYGFQLYIEQPTYTIDRQHFDAKRFTKIAEWISRKPGFRFEHFKLDQAEHYARHFVEVYNKAWERFVSFEPYSVEKVMEQLKPMRHILIEEFIWFAYVNNEPAGVMVMIPDINQVLAHLEGKMDTWGRMKFRYYKQTQSMTRAKGLVFGVVPKYRKYGLETVMIYKFYKEVSKTWQYNTVEISWAGRFNERMASLMKNVNAQVTKNHHTYRFLFDSKLPFEPYEVKSKQKLV